MSKQTIITGDALNTNLEDESIDLVVTSPPYFSFREYREDGIVQAGIGDEQHPWQFIESLLQWMWEMKRVVRDQGNIFVVLGDKYAGSGGHNNAGIGGSKERGPKSYKKSSIIDLRDTGSDLIPIEIPNKSRMMLPTRFAERVVDDLGLVLRQEIIWSKPNSIPTNARDRGEFTHEYIFHFTKQGKHYASPNLPRYTSVWDITPSEGVRVTKKDCNRLGVDQHFAPFPTEIPRRAISGWCPPDGMILDPFGGSGTTAVVAKALDRDCISLDLSSTYTKLARWRCYVSDHANRLQEKWSSVENEVAG